ncbi:MAG: Modification methylase MjaV [Candidatus Heimdallarchaeota archaeon LC_2]|nr:MAG: Modification methylase MjaV [Candidatus Heimdallarchaeota archaeon LC_2]
MNNTSLEDFYDDNASNKPKSKKKDKRKKKNPEPKYDPRNKLNNLDGRQWIKFLKSWFIFDAKASDLKEEREITKDTEQHPATFSPTMISDFINFFTKKGMTVLDPFAGIGTTLVACERTQRKGIGIELNQNFAEIATMRVLDSHQVIIDDARNIKDLNLPEIDFCITSPPYWRMLNKIDVNQKKREEKGLMTDYGDFNADLGKIEDYNEFLKILLDIFDQIYDKLRNKAYLVIIVQNIVDKGEMMPFAWELALELAKGRYVLKKEKIWCQDKKGLHPFGYPYAWVSNTFHHYCLVFRKEE